jgi:hypothetical protein
LSSLLEDPAFAKARQNRAVQRLGILEDAVIAHNMTVSEEMLHLDALSINGDIKDQKIETNLIFVQVPGRLFLNLLKCDLYNKNYSARLAFNSGGGSVESNFQN